MKNQTCPSLTIRAKTSPPVVRRALRWAAVGLAAATLAACGQKGALVLPPAAAASAPQAASAPTPAVATPPAR